MKILVAILLVISAVLTIQLTSLNKQNIQLKKENAQLVQGVAKQEQKIKDLNIPNSDISPDANIQIMDRKYLAGHLNEIMKLSWNLRDNCTVPNVGGLRHDKKCEQFYNGFLAEITAMSEELYCDHC